MKYDIAESNRRQDEFLRNYDDEKARLCSQCNGNDGYLYSTKVPGEWLCKSCHDDHELEAYRGRNKR